MQREDLNILYWLYSRLINLHGEKESYDYMIKFLNIINLLTKEHNKYKKLGLKNDLHFELRSKFFDKMKDSWTKDDLIHMDCVSDAFDETISDFLENIYKKH